MDEPSSIDSVLALLLSPEELASFPPDVLNILGRSLNDATRTGRGSIATSSAGRWRASSAPLS